MNKTSIEWTDSTWSPLRVYVKDDAAQIARNKGYTSLIQIAEKMTGSIGPHCEHVSPGCENCYAATNNHRCLPNNGTGLPYDRRSRDLVQSFVDEHILDKPLRARKPQKIFVENQSDLFGEWYSLNDLEKVWRVICGALHKGHTFQILTKRPERMSATIPVLMNRVYGFHWRMPDGIWLGVSVENKRTKERIEFLRDTSAAVRFLSLEPLLEDLGVLNLEGISWVIVGGESGPGARPMSVEWAMSIVEQCEAADVPVFMKQLGTNPTDVLGPMRGAMFPQNDRKGGDFNSLPASIRIRQFPRENGGGGKS